MGIYTMFGYNNFAVSFGGAFLGSFFYQSSILYNLVITLVLVLSFMVGAYSENTFRLLKMDIKDLKNTIRNKINFIFEGNENKKDKNVTKCFEKVNEKSNLSDQDNN